MSCIYSNFNGECQMGQESFVPMGCKDGYCVVEDDPDPGFLCEDYQSDDDADDTWDW